MLMLLGGRTMILSKEEIYTVYSNNLDIMEIQINSVKKIIQKSLGDLEWRIKYNRDSPNILLLQNEIFSNTRLFTFLISSWFEARLKKIVYQPSSAAFNKEEIKHILRNKSKESWKVCFEIAVCHSYGLSSYNSIKRNNSNIPLDEYNNILRINDLFLDNIKEAIGIRNHLAHGEWKTQLTTKNNNNKKIKQVDFFDEYDNIQKLDLLHKYYSLIAEIIENYVVYTDKRNKDFGEVISTKIDKLEQQRKRIYSSDFTKYVKPFLSKEIKRRDKMKD